MRIVILAVVLGLVAWLLTFLPIPEPFHTIILVVMVLALLWEVIAALGYVPSALPRRSPPP